MALNNLYFLRWIYELINFGLKDKLQLLLTIKQNGYSFGILILAIITGVKIANMVQISRHQKNHIFPES